MTIRQATPGDVPYMVDLSEKKRIQYQEFQPLFWRKAKDSRERQLSFFGNQLNNEHLKILVSENSGSVDGFLIANFRNGRDCQIDDFAVADESLWESVGKELLLNAGEEARKRGIARYFVVCGHRDEPKRLMLRDFGLHVDQYFFTAPLDHDPDVSTGVVRKATEADREGIEEIAHLHNLRLEGSERSNAIMLVSERNGSVNGYVIALVVPTPPVYDPGGPTCLILESAMKESGDWATDGKSMLVEAHRNARQQGSVQYMAVCEANIAEKQHALHHLGASIATEMYAGVIL